MIRIRLDLWICVPLCQAFAVLLTDPAFAAEEHRILHLHLDEFVGLEYAHLAGFSGSETVSRLFSFELDIVFNPADTGPSPSEIGNVVGKKVAFGHNPEWTDINTGDPGYNMYFNGFVSRFVAGDVGADLTRHYRARVVPWLWFLTLRSNFRTFENMTVPEIVEEIFEIADGAHGDGTVGFAARRWNLTRPYPTLECATQYRETDFNFVSRLLEEEGIFYFFTHDREKHVLVLADSFAATTPPSEQADVYYRDGPPQACSLSSWEQVYEFRSGSILLGDFDFRDPMESLVASATTRQPSSGPDTTQYEIFDYPGEFADYTHGDVKAQNRIDEEDSRREYVQGSSNCIFSPGREFVIHNPPDGSGTNYVVTSIRHTAGTMPGNVYSNNFDALPSLTTYRPPRSTPKPVVTGVQIATVVEPNPTEKAKDRTDEYGRIKVQYPWGRSSRNSDDEKTSCWARVAQYWSNRNFNGVRFPEIDDEVLVEFLDGNPDRPIIIGRVYNGDDISKSVPEVKAKDVGEADEVKGNNNSGKKTAGKIAKVVETRSITEHKGKRKLNKDGEERGAANEAAKSQRLEAVERSTEADQRIRENEEKRAIALAAAKAQGSDTEARLAAAAAEAEQKKREAQKTLANEQKAAAVASGAAVVAAREKKTKDKEKKKATKIEPKRLTAETKRLQTEEKKNAIEQRKRKAEEKRAAATAAAAETERLEAEARLAAAAAKVQRMKRPAQEEKAAKKRAAAAEAERLEKERADKAVAEAQRRKEVKSAAAEAVAREKKEAQVRKAAEQKRKLAMKRADEEERARKEAKQQTAREAAKEAKRLARESTGGKKRRLRAP